MAMPFSFGFLAAASAVAVSALYYLITSWQLKRKAIALGCKPVPVWRARDLFGISTVMTMTKAMSRNRLSEGVHDMFKEVQAREGRDCTTFALCLPPGMFHILTSDPRNLQAVLATQFKDFQLPSSRVAGFNQLLGQGIFSSNGERWAHSRALIRPQFNREQIADLDLFEKHLENLFNILDRQVDSQGWTQNSDIQHFIELFTIDTATEFLFGESVNSLEGKTEPDSLATKEEMKIFVDSFVAAEKVTAEALFYNDLYWILHDRKFKEQCSDVHKFVDTYVQRRLKSPNSERKGKFVVLDALVNDTKDPIELRYELLNLLLAGADTIKASMTFLLGSLAQNPAVFEKLRATVLQDFGTFGQRKNITISSLKACTYLQWCLNETLRMYAPVPSNYREAVRDTTLPFGGGPDGQSPVFVPKGRYVNWSLWTMHSNPEVWGPDAEKFNPDRWEKLRPGFNYLPFNAGPRICIGQQFALAETAYVVVRLLQKFDAIDGSAVPEGRLPCEWKLVDRVAGGLKVRFHNSEVEKR